MIITGIILLLLEGLLSNYVSYLPFFYPLKLSLVLAFVLLLPFLYPNKKEYLFGYVFILGLVYDLFYTDIYFLHSFLFGSALLLVFFLKEKRLSSGLTYLLSFFYEASLHFLLACLLYHVSIRFYFTYIYQYFFSNSIILLPLLLAFYFFPKKMNSKTRKKYKFKTIP